MSSHRSDIVDFTLILHHETEKAILVSEVEGGSRVWLPKSKIEFERKEGRLVDVQCPEWLAIERELV